MTETHWEMDKSEENRMEKNKNSGAALARKMAVSLVCGLAAGFAFMMLREKLVASGNSGIWQTINDLLFQDITAEGAERALGLFYKMCIRDSRSPGGRGCGHPRRRNQ